MSHVLFVNGILLVSAKQEIVKQNCLFKQLYEIGQRFVALHGHIWNLTQLLHACTLPVLDIYEKHAQ